MNNAAEVAMFSRSWRSWLIVHHLLPLSSLRTLIDVCVDALRPGTKLGALLTTQCVDGPTWAEAMTFALRQLDDMDEAERKELGRLQDFARSLLWQNDGDIAGVDAPYTKELMALLDVARSDTSTLPGALRRLGNVNEFNDDFLAVTCEVLGRVAGNSSKASESWMDDVKGRLAKVPSPLGAVLAKHVGDLLVDADDLVNARVAFAHAKELLTKDPPAELPWQSWMTLVDASLATTKAFLESSFAGAQALTTALEQSGWSGLPLVNMSLSRQALLSQADPHRWRDERASLVLSPLSVDTHDLDQAAQYALLGKFDDAHRVFWAKLRRRIATGSSVAFAEARGTYGIALLKQPGSSRDMALHLLIQSERNDLAATIQWTTGNVGTLTGRDVQDLIEVATRYSARCLGRTRVLLTMAFGWLHVSAVREGEAALVLANFAADVAQGEPIKLSGAESNTREGIKFLLEFSKRAPERRSAIAGRIVGVVRARLRRDQFWVNAEQGIQLASEYVSVLTQPDAEIVADAILDLLSADAEQGPHPVTRAALSFLTEPVVVLRHANDSEFGAKLDDAVLRIALTDETALFVLHHIEPARFADPHLADTVPGAVEKFKESASANSSATIYSIRGLLLFRNCPSLIAVGLSALCAVLGSVTSQRRRHLQLPHAYDVLFDLARDFGEEFRDTSEHYPQLKDILSATTQLWRRSVEDPKVFAPFSLPEQVTANPVVVHNWVWASVRFARAFGDDHEHSMVETIRSVVTDGAAVEVKRGILEAFASGLDPSFGIEYATDGDTYYHCASAGLGRVFELDEEAGNSLLKLLCRRCFQHGPAPADLGILALARERFGSIQELNIEAVETYRQRLRRAEPSLRNLIAPLFKDLP